MCSRVFLLQEFCDTPIVFLALAACPCCVVLAHFRSSGVVFVSGLFLFDFRIEFEAPIQPPLLVAGPVLQLVSELG